MPTISRDPAQRFRLLRGLLLRHTTALDEITLGAACREMDRQLADEGETTGTNAREISRHLRALRFAKAGMIGSGYDREPLYRRIQP